MFHHFEHFVFDIYLLFEICVFLWLLVKTPTKGNSTALVSFHSLFSSDYRLTEKKGIRHQEL